MSIPGVIVMLLPTPSLAVRSSQVLEVVYWKPTHPDIEIHHVTQSPLVVASTLVRLVGARSQEKVGYSTWYRVNLRLGAKLLKTFSLDLKVGSRNVFKLILF